MPCRFRNAMKDAEYGRPIPLSRALEEQLRQIVDNAGEDVSHPPR